jgi:hypothetical protein
MIWEACNGPEHVCSISGSLYRLVESQEQVATTGYVDTLEEQAVLEELLNNSKPDYPTDAPNELHYLLKTPFRYPPLLWGSRFGRVHEPSLFYGGATLEATLSESAYYCFVFLLSMEAKPPKPRLNTEHRVFSVGYESERGIRLQKAPFNSYQDQLADRQHYSASQALGTSMRSANIEAFEYVSARSVEPELCVALFTPTAFTRNDPDTMEHWLCELTAEQVAFKSIRSSRVYRFPRTQFEVKGRFPMPA